MYRKPNPVIHAPLRLAVMNLLVKEKQAEFNFMLKETATTAGNLSAQLNKLNKAGYIEIIKQFKGNYPMTVCSITKSGLDAFREYAETIRLYITIEQNNPFISY